MCLTPSEPTKDWTIGERLIDIAVRSFQPSPEIVHCELFIPPSSTGAKDNEKFFATYIGRTAGFYDSDPSATAFYFGENSGKWRAIPIATRDASNLLRSECRSHINTPYSLWKYPFSAPPFRAFATLLPAAPLVSAHCATVSAKILARSLPSPSFKHTPAWYGPSTLMIEASTGSIAHQTRDYLDQREHTKATTENEELLTTTDTLVRGTDDAVKALSQSACSAAIRNMAVGVASRFDHGDDVGSSISQQLLATAVLRWSLIR